MNNNNLTPAQIALQSTLARPRPPTRAEIEAEKAKCAADPVYFINRYCKIYDSVQAKWIPFTLWDAQIEALQTVIDNKYTVVLKARQEGLSWLLGDAYPLWQMIFTPIAKILMFSQRDDEAKALLARMKGTNGSDCTFSLLPDWLKPRVVIDNEHEFQLDNGSNAQALPATAGGRSNAATYVFIDEADYIEGLAGLITAAQPTVDAGRNKMVVCSTRDKDKSDSTFQRLYKATKDVNSQWKGVFLAWYARPDRTACHFVIEDSPSPVHIKYTAQAGSDSALIPVIGADSPDLRLLNITRHSIRVVASADTTARIVSTQSNVDDWQAGDVIIELRWYDAKAADKLRTDGSLDNLYGEYPETDLQALSDRELNKRFPPQWISLVTQQRKPLPIPIDAPALIGLRIYAYPEPGRKYGIGADPAGGLTDSDYSVACVIDAETKKQVAVLSGKIEPTTFGDNIADLAVYYNGAAVNFELNNHGHAVKAKFKERGTSLRNGITKNGPSRNPGWFTTEWAKSYLYDKAVAVIHQAMEEARLAEQQVEPLIFDFTTSTELASIDRNELSAPPGQHDDHAMAWALAQMCVYRGTSNMFQVPHSGLWDKPIGSQPFPPDKLAQLRVAQQSATVTATPPVIRTDLEQGDMSFEEWTFKLRQRR